MAQRRRIWARPVVLEVLSAISMLSLANCVACDEFGLNPECLAAIQSKETGTGPMRIGDRLRNLAERGIGFPGIFETVFRHDDCVCPPAPFPHKPRPRPDAWTGIRSNASVRLQFPGQRYEFPLSRFAEAAIGKFLHAIGDSADK